VEEVEVRLIRDRRQTVAQAPRPRTFQRGKLVGAVRKIDRVYETPDEVERSGSAIGLGFGSHQPAIITVKTG
jgi:hypothetical protein